MLILFLELDLYMQLFFIILIILGLIIFFKKYKQGKILDFDKKLKPLKLKKAKSFRLYEERFSVVDALFFYLSTPGSLIYLPDDIAKYVKKERKKGNSYSMIALKLIYGFIKFIILVVLVILFLLIFFYIISKITNYVMINN